MFSVSDIVSTFLEHEWYQQGMDRVAKGEMGTEAVDAVEARIIRRREVLGQPHS